MVLLFFRQIKVLILFWHLKFFRETKDAKMSLLYFLFSFWNTIFWYFLNIPVKLLHVKSDAENSVIMLTKYLNECTVQHFTLIWRIFFN